MASILILYSTVDGQSLKICSHLEQLARQRGHEVTLVDIGQADSTNPDAFERIVVGASIRYGKHHKQVYEFVRQHRQVLDQHDSTFFSVNAVARKPNRNTPQTNPYLKKFLKEVDWQPAHTAVFAGRIDYPRYNWRERAIIRLIMWLTKGPTDPNTCVEFTDWQQVDGFAGEIFAD